MKSRALARLGLDANSPSVTVRDRLANGQLDPGPGIFGLVGNKSEGLEDGLRKLLVEADAAIGDLQPKRVVFHGAAHANIRGFSRLSIFYRIGENVAHEAGEL